jgi:Ca2+/H+ antiporter, TMEM165/GDT1 family
MSIGLALYLPALVVAFLITLLEMTEVVALVFAIGADQKTLRHGTLGAVTGTAVVALLALGSGAALIALPHSILLWASAVVLAAFGVFLFRSTLRTYRRERAARAGTPSAASRSHAAVQFAGGFTVGAIEATETVVVLIALAAAGYGGSAIVGAVVGGAVLVVAAIAVHERIRRIKVPWLKLGATSLIFTFSVFWAGEALGVPWPGADLFLIPMFVVSLVIVRAGLELFLRRTPRPLPKVPA